MFENKKTAQQYIMHSSTLIKEFNEATSRRYSSIVHQLYDDKITSTDGKYRVYKVTMSDLSKIFKAVLAHEAHVVDSLK